MRIFPKGIKLTERFILSVLCFTLLLLPSKGNAQTADSATIDEIYFTPLKRSLFLADSLNLVKHPRWVRLLHMYSSGGDCSDFDGGPFFISPKGRCDSESELKATLNAFYQNPQKNAIHAQAKFPARLKFLIEQKVIDSRHLPKVDLSPLEFWRKGVNAQGIKLVYATGYMGNPASIMGHVFLRFINPENKNGKENLDYAILFSAEAGSDRGVFYAIKGIFGGFAGRYSISQYHIQMQTYLSMESRDLWEYDLNLTQSEIDYLVDHLWETADSWQNYYFFTENCSYGLLTALEAASLRLDFTDIRSGVVLPVETLKEIQKIPDLLQNPSFDPSIKVRFLDQVQNIDPLGQSLLAPLLDPYSSIKPQNVDSIALQFDISNKKQLSVIYDAALDYIQFQKRAATDSSKRMPWSQWQKKVLWGRSKLPLGYFGFSTPVPPPTEAPHLATDPHMISLGMGFKDYESQILFEYRFYYHGQNESTLGLPRGLNLELLRGKLSFFPPYELHKNRSPANSNKFRFEEFTFFNVANASPINPWISPLSWHVAMTTLRPEFGGPIFTEGRFGLGSSFGSNKPLGSLFTLTADLSQKLWHSVNKYSIAPGLSLRIRSEWNSELTLFAKSSFLKEYLYLDDYFLSQRIGFTYNLSPQLDLNLMGTYYLLPSSLGQLHLNINFYH